MDFGSILCWASNEIGRQDDPCIFHLLPAGKPEPVTNCTVLSSSYSTMHITCLPGFNGGLKQTFALEIRETDSPSKRRIIMTNNFSTMVGNITGRTRPDFMLTGLMPDTGYMISVLAVNSKGRSDPMVIQAYTQKSDQLFETNESALTNMDGFQITPVFGILVTIGCAMAIVFLSISAYFCVRKRTTMSSPAPQASMFVQYTPATANIAIRERPAKQAENPDIVPAAASNRQELTTDGACGFEVQGDKTKFATLQRQRKQLYDEIRDSKCRVQSLRRNLLSPQYEGTTSSSEKLLINEMETVGGGGSVSSPQHVPYASTFASSSGGRPSPCSTPTPPPYNRNRIVGSPVLGANQVCIEMT